LLDKAEVNVFWCKNCCVCSATKKVQIVLKSFLWRTYFLAWNWTKLPILGRKCHLVILLIILLTFHI